MIDPAFADGTAFIDNEYMPVGEARIPILDRGFVRSDATYDVAHVWQGLIFRLDDHLDRFERNCARLRLTPPHPRAEMREILLECVRKAGLTDAYVAMVCTRGVPVKGTRDPRIAEHRFYAYAIPFVWMSPLDKHEAGLNVHLSDIPRIPPSSVDPTTKNFHWADLTSGLFEAFDAGCDTEVLSDGAGNVTEGPGFNIFIVKDGALATPASGVFDGMTRRTTIELARELGIEVDETTVSADAVRAGDEVFLTTTVGGILPVTRIDGVAIGNGKAGPVTWRLRGEYWERKAKGWLGERVAAA